VKLIPPLICSAESSIGFGRREEGTQQAAKQQLSVRTKKSYKFLEDTSTRFLNAIKPNQALNVFK